MTGVTRGLTMCVTVMAAVAGLTGCGAGPAATSPASAPVLAARQVHAILQDTAPGRPCQWTANIIVHENMTQLAAATETATVTLAAGTAQGTWTWQDTGTTTQTTVHLARTPDRLSLTTTGTNQPRTVTTTLTPRPAPADDPDITQPGLDPLPLLGLYQAIHDGAAIDRVIPQVSQIQPTTGQTPAPRTSYLVDLSTQRLADSAPGGPQPWQALAAAGTTDVQVTVTEPDHGYYTLSETIPIVAGTTTTPTATDITQQCRW